MTNIELAQTKGPFGDACSLYSFTPKSEHLTLQDLIADARRTTGDWGYIEVSFAGTKFTLEYRHGQVISSDIPEGLYEKEITGGTAYGGWSRMDYMVEIPTPGYGGLAETLFKDCVGNRLGVNVREVVAISAPDEPGALARILEAVDKTGANVEYMYAFAVARGASARFVFRFDDTAKAVAALSAAGISLLDDSTIFA